MAKKSDRIGFLAQDASLAVELVLLACSKGKWAKYLGDVRRIQLSQAVAVLDGIAMEAQARRIDAKPKSAPEEQYDEPGDAPFWGTKAEQGR